MEGIIHVRTIHDLRASLDRDFIRNPRLLLLLVLHLIPPGFVQHICHLLVQLWQFVLGHAFNLAQEIRVFLDVLLLDDSQEVRKFYLIEHN